MVQEEKPSWKKRTVDELRKLAIAVIYIWVLLSVFGLYREIILANYHINYSAKFGFALINAVILAKFMWFGEILHAGKRAVGKSPVVFDSLERRPFCCHFNGLPSFGRNCAQVVARTIHRREFFRNRGRPTRYICNRTGCVCGANPLLFLLKD